MMQINYKYYDRLAISGCLDTQYLIVFSASFNNTCGCLLKIQNAASRSPKVTVLKISEKPSPIDQHIQKKKTIIPVLGP